MRRTASGPCAQKSSSPIFSMPTSGASAAASRSASSRSDTSSATISGRSGRGITSPPRLGAHRRAQLHRRRQRSTLQLRHDPLGDRHRRGRVDHRRDADLHRGRARRAVASIASAADAMPPLASNGIRGSARATSATARSVSGLRAGPDNQPGPAPSVVRDRRRVDRVGRRRPGQREPASLPRGRPRSRSAPRRALRASSRTPARATSARPRRRSRSRVRRAHRASAAPSSSSGPDRSISIPRTPGCPWSALVSRTYSSSEPPPIDTINGVPTLAQRGSSAAMNASMPGFCSPVFHTMPERRLRDPRGRRTGTGLDGDRPRHDRRRPCAVRPTRDSSRPGAGAARRRSAPGWGGPAPPDRPRESASRSRSHRRPVRPRRLGGSRAAARPAIPQDARGVEHRPVHARPRVVLAGAILARDRHGAGAAQAEPASHALLDRDLGRELPRATERRRRLAAPPAGRPRRPPRRRSARSRRAGRR